MDDIIAWQSVDKYEVDHIIPISKGGKHSLSNLQYLTKEENRRKSNKIIRE
jgi:5-methylcytosine-specific restriction endonuclease McrA